MVALVIAEHDNRSLKAGTYNTVTAAAQCGDEVHVLVAGSAAQAVVHAAVQIAGVSKVLVADGTQFADGLAENVAAQVAATAAAYTHVLAPATSYGKNILPRVAALLDVAQISEITKVVAPDIFERPIYAGNAVATVRSRDRIKVITVRTTAFEAAATGGEASTEALVPVPAMGHAVLHHRELANSERPELAGARVVIAGGRGMGSGEAFKLLEPLADKLGAAIGASRAAVDAGFVPNDLQVGQTGKIVAPQLYIAVGISGAIQHLAGMKESKTIVAINKDPEAPIFSVADYGLVGDLFEIVPELTRQLAA